MIFDRQKQNHKMLAIVSHGWKLFGLEDIHLEFNQIRLNANVIDIQPTVM